MLASSFITSEAELLKDGELELVFSTCGDNIWDDCICDDGISVLNGADTDGNSVLNVAAAVAVGVGLGGCSCSAKSFMTWEADATETPGE